MTGFKMNFDKLKEECGIFGGVCNFDIAPILKCALIKLQHRGQDGSGICVQDDNSSQTLYKKMGLVNTALQDDKISLIKGKIGIAHNRYSTFGSNSKENLQPLKTNYMTQDVSLVHNGNVCEAKEVRENFEKSGEVFMSSSDSEVILKTLVLNLKKEPNSWTFDEIAKVLNATFSKGAYCIIIQLKDRILAYRDPFGYRPLMLAKTKSGTFVASEDVAFHNLKVEKLVEIQAGCGVEITKDGYNIKQFAKSDTIKQCVFEQIYFANPASNIFSKNVYQTRVELGKLIAQNEEQDFCADMVVPVLDSGLACALGYSHYSKIPFHLALIRNNFLERSFIQSSQDLRENNVSNKFMAIKPLIEGKSVVLVDDSLVRGTTSSLIVKIIKEAGAREIHLRLASSEIVDTCFFGVDIPEKNQLLSYNNNCQNIAKIIGADSVKFLPQSSLDNVFKENVWCKDCFKKEE